MWYLGLSPDSLQKLSIKWLICSWIVFQTVHSCVSSSATYIYKLQKQHICVISTESTIWIFVICICIYAFYQSSHCNENHIYHSYLWISVSCHCSAVSCLFFPNPRETNMQILERARRKSVWAVAGRCHALARLSKYCEDCGR